MSQIIKPQQVAEKNPTTNNKRNPRFDILFAPVKLGPVTGPNRFYQVPPASGMTNALPGVRAKFRETKAGGSVICTGACSIRASASTFMTNELPQVHQAFARRGIKLRTLKRVSAFDGDTPPTLPGKTRGIVGMRGPKDALYHDLIARADALAKAGIKSADVIGDALAPGALTHVIHSGHRDARKFGEPVDDLPYRLDAPIVTVPLSA